MSTVDFPAALKVMTRGDDPHHVLVCPIICALEGKEQMQQWYELPGEPMSEADVLGWAAGETMRCHCCGERLPYVS
jgi:hypothetical protein